MKITTSTPTIMTTPAPPACNTMYIYSEMFLYYTKLILISQYSEGPPLGSEIPQEYRAEVDRVFLEFLSRICSNCTSSSMASTRCTHLVLQWTPPTTKAILSINN